MNEPVIRVENLAKRYLVGHFSTNKRESYVALRDVLARGVHNFVRKASDLLRGRQIVQGDDVEEFWALKDVSFEVNRGDVLGIIGRNGAGKSTLLKILSRITEPTKGRVVLRGRVASLLEVGTGFHPELTGRENIFLNGAILGMSRLEILQKFDEIVAFAEVEKFLDTPVKRYSSGMYVRLAFAVAAHLEPEVLIIDEVLAVGDTQFQSKCLKKMSSVAKSGRTVVFVSHNMRAIQGLCTSTILLRNGGVAMAGTPQQCADAYLRFDEIAVGGIADLSSKRVPRRGSGRCKFTRFELLSKSGARSGAFAFGEPFDLRVSVLCESNFDDAVLGFSFITSDGIEIMGSVVHDGGLKCDLTIGINEFECSVSPMVLTPGKFLIRGAVFWAGEVFDHIDEILEFDILNIVAEDAMVPHNHYVGMVYVPYRWKRIGAKEKVKYEGVD